MKVWPFPLIRSYHTSRGLTALFERFAEAPDMVVKEQGAVWLRLECSYGTLEIWNANKWYAWASQGKYVAPSGVAIRWEDELPSRWAVRRMRQALDNRFGVTFDGQFEKADSARRAVVDMLARM